MLRAAAEALKGRLGYTEALGIRPLRERIARHYGEAYGVELSPARVMVTTGSSGGFNLVFLGAFDAGDRIAMASPAYPAYRNILKALGLVAVEIPVGPDTRWALTAEHVEAGASRSAARRRARREPRQSDRHDDLAGGARSASSNAATRAASASSPTRSITASSMRAARRRRFASASMRSSSTRSPNITA